MEISLVDEDAHIEIIEGHKAIRYKVIGIGKNINGNVMSCFNVFSDSSCGYNNSLLDNGGTYVFADDVGKVVWFKRHVSSIGNNKNYGLRPIIFLSKGIKVVGGTGTMDDPYVISR